MGNIFSVSLSCDTLVTRCWDYSCGQAEFVSNLEENLHALTTALAELKEQRNDIARRVKIAEEQHEMKQLDQVHGWLERAETLINEADALISASPREVQRLCLGGCCSWNPMSSRKFGKEIAQKLQQIEVLKSKGDFDVVADRAPKALVTEQPCEPAVGLESTFNMVCSSLEEEGVRIIGLYGIGGVGKTRLLTEINNRFGFSNHGFYFDMLIWVVVSKGFYVGKIQDDIAQKIGLSGGTWNDKTSEEKASNIFQALNRRKFMLLLDDIWERVDLSEVGIPIPTHENGCKLIFTTRSLEVCGQMGAQKKIEVKCLSKEDAWKLFQEKVGEGTLDSHPRIREIAHEVVNECEGLPLALITIGRAMACKHTPEEWEYAIGVLKRSSAASIFPEMHKKVYPLLKFSYDSLPNDLVRSCLLYCSLFSEDFIISKERVIDCWIAEGFLDEHDSETQARNHGHHIIGCVLQACLLEKASYNLEVKMHDVIRDMALWITCTSEEEKWKCFVQARYQLTNVPEVAKWRGIQRMSLMNNKIENLIEAPNCPNLQTLFLNGNELKVIHCDFFQFMGGLKVLDLSYNHNITELPLSISKLVSLEYLNLSSTGIRQLPIELKALEKLKCLNLSLIRPCVTVPRMLISAFSKLQVLRMHRSFALEHNKWLVEELQSLNHLNVLTVTIRRDFAFQGLLSAERLHSCIERIHLEGLRGTEQFNILSLANVRSLKQLDLDGCRSLKELKIELAEEGRMIKYPAQFQTSMVVSQQWFQSLCLVQIRSCSELKDLTWLILAPNVTHLNVMDCHKMEEIINKRKLSQVATHVGNLSPFERLESLALQYLPELNSICNGELPFSCLKSIYVSKCPKLRRLPLNLSNAKGNKICIEGEKEWWNQLEWEDESTRHEVAT